VLHSPLAPLGLLLLAHGRRRLLPVAVGMALHLALDAHHEARMDRARNAALERDGFSCRHCGTRTPHVATHLMRQPRLLPSYAAHNLISLCEPCHEAEHAWAS
jgi:hypothetical protein